MKFRELTRMAALGALQGFALWLLRARWPSAPHAAALCLALVFFVVVSALVLHFARTGRDLGRLLALAVSTGCVFATVSLWIGWQLPPKGAAFEGDASRVSTWILASGVALYALGPFLQIYQASGILRFPYTELYRHSWNNFFIAALGALFAAALWTVLLLWMELFALIGIEFFIHLFSAEPFIFPVTGAALGYGLAEGHASQGLIATLRGLTQSLFRLLLPLVALVTLGFLGALPFTGLEPLFKTRFAAQILIAWLSTYVLFLNAVYLDGDLQPPYGTALRRLVEVGLLSLPVLAAIAIHAVRLRITQHGLTPERMYALVFVVVLAAYALGYAGAVVLRGEPWLPNVRRVNVGLALVVVALALLLHTPLLDPLAFSVRDQIGRLRSGVVEPARFDFGDLRFHLGRRGFEALNALAEAAGSNGQDPTVRRIRAALAVQDYWEWSEGVGAAFELEGKFQLLPPDSAWPRGLGEALRKAAKGRWQLQRCGKSSACLVFPVDLDNDGQPEELVFLGGTRPEVLAFGRMPSGEWKPLGTFRAAPVGPERQASEQSIRAGDYRVTEPRYRDLEIGGWRFQLEEIP